MAATMVMFASPAMAGEADIIGAEARRAVDGSWTISATILHADEGWDHYADRFEIVAPDGEILGTRTLLHPHVHEQPFTRGLSEVAIPDEVDFVTIRAHDSTHEYGGVEYTLTLTR